MERDVWRGMVAAIRRLPRWSPAGALYDNRSVLAVLFWAALHDRSILWATQRRNWPAQAWRRGLPDQSTMSRRLRDPRILDDLRRLPEILQRGAQTAAVLLVDGKALPVSNFSHDPDARNGWGAGGHAKGYKLHLLIDSCWRMLAWEVRPMNEAECTVAQELVRDASERGVLPAQAVMLADASYDSNPLHATAAAANVRMIAPRRKAERSLSPSHPHHPNRLRSIVLTERDAQTAARLRSMRSSIEQFFGALASVGGGLISLPAWSRRLTRVRCWVGAKLALHAARLAMPRINHA